MGKTLLERMEDKVLIGDDCWLWTGAVFSNGYGHMHHDGRNLLAHRAMYEILMPPIERGMVLDHLCRQKACVRPSHLEPVSQSTNLRRGIGVGGLRNDKRDRHGRFI